MAIPAKTLTERINSAAAELKLARRDGSAEWITQAAKKLDDLIDQLPRPVKESL